MDNAYDTKRISLDFNFAVVRFQVSMIWFIVSNIQGKKGAEFKMEHC